MKGVSYYYIIIFPSGFGDLNFSVSFLFFFFPLSDNEDEPSFDPLFPEPVSEPPESEDPGYELLEEEEDTLKPRQLLSDLFLGDEPLHKGTKVTLKDAICCLFVFYLVSHLSKTAFNQLLRLLHLIFPRNLLPKNVNEFLRLFRGSDGKTRTHEYCEDCQVAFGENEKRCSLCNGWRYLGGEADQRKKRKKAFFVELPLEHDLRDLFKGELLQHVPPFIPCPSSLFSPFLFRSRVC